MKQTENNSNRHCDLRQTENDSNNTATQTRRERLCTVGVGLQRARDGLLPSNGVARRRVPDNIWGIPVPKRLRDGWPVKIWKVEEKGSDVSLGSRLTLDAAQHKADLFEEKREPDVSEFP